MATARNIESLAPLFSPESLAQQANVTPVQDGRISSLSIEPEDGGFKEKFVVTVENKYKCEHCCLPLCNPKQTACGHRFCGSCMQKILGNPNSVCPLDNEPLYEDAVFTDTCCRKEILALQIYCRNEINGCKRQLPLGKLEAHLHECPYQEVRCARRGCTEKVQRKDLADHLNSTCTYREQACKYCNKKITIAELKKHEDFDCPAFLVLCPNKCNTFILRGELNNHQLQCLNVTMSCPFSQYGCNFQGNNQEMKMHEVSTMAQHLKYVLLKNEHLEKTVLDLQNKLQEKCKMVDIMSAQISHLEKEQSKFAQLASKNESRLGHMQKMLASQTDKLMNIDQTSQQTYQRQEETARDANILRESIDHLQTRIRQLELPGRTAGPGMGAASLTELSNQLKRFDSLLSVHDVRLADMDLRFQLLETVSYNGKLIWKIRDYRRRKQEAVNGKTLSLYSQPFYTGYFGYKMCARVYLNGDGMGKGTHLSLFFVIMRGEYDALLPWPFKQKVTLMLLDQGQANRHLGDAFKPDPNSSSFKQPVGEMNIASGCPLFVAQTVLESGTYIKDDTIFIKVVVDTSDMPDP
ncbi:TNF receptor-associated factor 3 isoform X1 [Hypanus sabinus]|uniref:TNF receptor-associated factor 3 isoform X1 n=1 Tax=Hypanus sabinus TaxID=79690 RepID=UPI0028C4C613|nr:TNF receptor-associated factor 3 isoform X1 [Hypanus sabinus]XP_059814831.1 TNF receptor-associated factor 3 isoform X1 [Hypanus sabinus]